MPNPSSGQISLSQINNAGTTTNSMGSLVNELIAGNSAAGQTVSLNQCYYTQAGSLTATLQATPLSSGFGSGQGWACAMSADGNIMVTGDPTGGSGTGSTAGKVFTWAYSGGSWSQIGTYLTDNTVGYGSRVALSANGLTLAVFNDASTVYIYQRSGSTYTQQYSGSFPGQYSTYPGGLSLSADGNILVVGSPTANRIYTVSRSGSTWTNGANIAGAGDMGQSTAISADGSIIFAGSPSFGGRGGYVYSRNPSTGALTQLATISGTNPGAGWSCSISADGLTVAIGPNGFSYGTQSVAIVKATSSSWSSYAIQSNVIWSNASSLNGYSVALSADGNVLAIGDPSAFSDDGQVTIVTRTGSTWTAAYYKRGGNRSKNGWGIAMGDNGNVVAGGAQQGPSSNFPTPPAAGGCVYIYK